MKESELGFSANGLGMGVQANNSCTLTVVRARLERQWSGGNRPNGKSCQGHTSSSVVCAGRSGPEGFSDELCQILKGAMTQLSHKLLQNTGALIGTHCTSSQNLNTSVGSK